MFDGATTYFAAAERAPRNSLESDRALLRDSEFIQHLLDAMPYSVLILNLQRQVVFCNEPLLKTLELDSEQEILGYRPGEVLQCEHADQYPNGCGTTEFCELCGAVQAILSAQSGRAETRECRVAVYRQNQVEALDIRVTATPFRVGNSFFTLLSIVDISDEKRRRILERIFFHDVLNTASALKNSSELLSIATNEGTSRKMVKLIPAIADRLLGEIQAQRELLQAENGELRTTEVTLDSLNMVSRVMQQASAYNDPLKPCNIVVDLSSDAVALEADPIILQRVLDNMTKNALEASKANDTVTLSCKKIADGVRFEVHNPGYIPKNVQLQIFLRSFSTKGTNRGIGTYSMKLLTERYLHGRIGFVTDEQTGTAFFAELPLQANVEENPAP